MTRSTDSRRVRWLGVAACATVVCAVSLIAGARPARAGTNVWTSNGPEGGNVLALAVDPATPITLYAGMLSGGVFKSTDGALNWQAVNTGLTNSYVEALAIDPTTPSTLYASTYGGVFKSTGGGSIWSATGLTNTSVFALAIDPTTPSTLYAGSGHIEYPQGGDCGYMCVPPRNVGDVYKSTDGGGTWSGVKTDLNGFVGALAIDPFNPATLYVGTDYGVFKAPGGGSTWSDAGVNGTVRALAIDPLSPATLYAGTGRGVFKSTDGGSTWSAANTDLGNTNVYRLAIDPLSPATLYAGTGGGVFKSTDGGDTWSALNTGLTNLDVQALTIDPIEPRRVYAGTAAGVFAIEQAQVVGDGTPTSCTEAALEAALAPGGLVTFDCGADPLTITITSTKTIAKNTTIDGGGRITISGANAVGVFVVISGVTFDVRNLTIANGKAHAEGGSYGGGSVGGGIASLGTLRVTNSTFSDNTAGMGGAISFAAALTTISNSTFSGNTAGEGGAIYSGVGSWTITVTNSTFSSNTADWGGAIFHIGEVMEVSNSTFSGNSAHNEGGVGGAIHNFAGLIVSNSIFSDGAIANAYYCPLFGCPDPTGSVTLSNTVIGQEEACGGICNGPGGSVTSTNTIIADPLLDPAGLKDNGGSTQTIALLPGSPAIDAGDPDVCANPPVNGVDQRGYARPGTGSANCSIGAFEYNAPGPPVTCIGDCANDGHVTIDELLTMVNIALGTASMSACDVGDPNNDDQITVDEILTAVSNALHGCA